MAWRRQAELGAVKDSKLLTQKNRVILNEIIQKNSEFKIIIIEPKEIDEAVESTDKNMNLVYHIL